MRITESRNDPVFVDGLKLRIGEPKRGQSRFVYLSPTEAKLVAYALLTEVAKAERPQSERPKANG